MELATAIPAPLLMMVTALIPAFNGEAALQKESCPANIARGTSGSVLIQSAFLRERFGFETNSATVPPSTHVENTFDPGDDGLKQFTYEFRPLNLSTNFTHVHGSSLLQHEGTRIGIVVADSAITNFKSWCGLSLASTVPLLLALLLLTVIIGAMCWLVNPPQTSSPRAEAPSRQGDNQSLTSDMLARTKYDPRAYASSSPNVPYERRQQIPLERAHSSPQVGNSPAPIINVPRGRTPPRGFPAQPSRTSSVPSNSGDINPRASAVGFQFCPELIVPQHCECILVVPLDRDQHSSFEVTDCNGSCVLRVVPQAPTAGRLWRATITSGTGELLVQCCEASYQASSRYAPEFHLLQAGGQLWAKLLHSPNQERYVLNFVNGGVLHFWGNFEEHAVNITNETNQLLATTEVGAADFDPKGRYYRLRVAPTADVGLAVCGLLCIRQHMASQRKANASI